MKKITNLILLLVCVFGYSQNDAKSSGTDSPMVLYLQQKQTEQTNVALKDKTNPLGVRSNGNGINNPVHLNQKAVNKSQYIPLYVASAYADNFGNSTERDVSTENKAAFKQAPLFLAPVALTEENEAEILANEQYQANLPLNRVPVIIQNRAPQSDIIPTAGTTETFSPSVGDHFFDPGRPGGSSTGGTPGNYHNCGCNSQTSLTGVSEINFQFFSVFATFDYLRIYDGIDATGTVLYDNSSGGANSGDITL